MFIWDKSVTQIDVPASQVVSLFRSMRDVQVALPGVPVQQASAYLCQVKTDAGVETLAVFHLLKSHQLAFYFSDPRHVPSNKVDSMLDQGLNFVESMGFLLSDMDIHLLDEGDREMLWDSLPLKSGAPQAEPAKPEAPAAKPEPKAPAKAKKAEKKPVAEKPKPAPPVQEKKAAAKPAPAEEPAADAEPEDSVDDLLAAVESMRAKRPGVRARKKVPAPEEIGKRRMELRENIGRILSSL